MDIAERSSMKIILGVTRVRVGSTGHAMRVQRASDMWEIELPYDGSEYLGSIWMDADGIRVMSLPVALGPEIIQARRANPV